MSDGVTGAPRRERLAVNLALQGGGSHGAFAWGALDRLLEEDWIEVDGISGTSAGAMNAAVFAHGIAAGGRDAARAALEDFWRRVSRVALLSPFQRLIDMRANPAVGLKPAAGITGGSRHQHLARAQHRHPVCYLHDILVMGNHQHRRALLTHLHYAVQEQGQRYHVYPRIRLVQYRQLGMHRQQGSQLYSFSFAAAQGIINVPIHVADRIQADHL